MKLQISDPYGKNWESKLCRWKCYILNFLLNEKKIQVNLRRSVPLRPSLSVYIGVMRSQRLVTIDSWCLINILYVCMYVCMCVYMTVMKLVHWPLISGLLHLVQRWPVLAPPRCTSASDSTCTQYCRRSALYKLLCMYVPIVTAHPSTASVMLQWSVALRF